MGDMKPKAQTLQQKMGFSDPDLTTPKHDELMLWLDHWIDNNYPTLLTEQKKQWFDDAQKQYYRCYEKLAVDEPKIIISRKVWEQPIVDRTYTIGFCDMLFEVQVPYKVDLEYPNGWRCAGELMLFEVKPVILSLGEVIRQIRMYQTYTRGHCWFIVSPDDRFRTQIESQDIGFVHVT